MQRIKLTANVYEFGQYELLGIVAGSGPFQCRSVRERFERIVTLPERRVGDELTDLLASVLEQMGVTVDFYGPLVSYVEREALILPGENDAW